MEALYTTLQKEFQENLSKLEDADEVKSVLLLLTNDKTFSVEFLTPILKSFKKPIIGGVFYEVIYNSEQKDNGVLLIPLSFELKTEVFNFEVQNTNTFKKLDSYYSSELINNGSIFIFVDAFSPSKSAFIEDLFNFFGFKYTFFGAGCGSDSFVSFPCVIHNTGIFGNAAVIGFTHEPINLGVAHGWTPVSEPLKVTESDESKILSINWEPAFEVYQNIVEKHSGLIFTDSNFSEIAKCYPIGLMKLDGEMVIRDPYSTKEGVLNCLDNVDTGQYITVMHGNVDSLIAGAAKAAETYEKENKVSGITSEFIFCVDCFSRVSFLGKDYSRELKAIEVNRPVNGVVTFGEIANIGDSFLEIYNKTIIVAGWKHIY